MATYQPGSSARNKDELSGANGAVLQNELLASQSMTLDDPISMHLLVETALADSKEFQVVSFEELDAFKQEQSALQTRIDSLRRKLELETKVRDAAKSLHQLQGWSDIKGRGAGADGTAMGQANQDLKMSENKIQDIQDQIKVTEERLMSIKFCLLEHTAGVLTNTYGNGHRPQFNSLGIAASPPYSADSLDDYESGFTTTRDPLDGFLNELRRGATPQKSAIDQSNQETQILIGQHLEQLSDLMRNMIAQINPENWMVNAPAPRLPNNLDAIDGTIPEQLKYLYSGLDQIRSEQRTMRMSRDIRLVTNAPRSQNRPGLQFDPKSSSQDDLAFQKVYEEVEDGMTGMLRKFNLHFLDALSNFPTLGPQPSPPPANARSSTHIRFARERLDVFSKLVANLTEAPTRSHNALVFKSNSDEQYETVLNGLWDIIMGGEQVIRELNRDARDLLAAREESQLDYDSADEVSPNEHDGLGDEFSLSAFSTKVQLLVSKSVSLKKKQNDLHQRMRQMQEAFERQNAIANPAIRTMEAEIERINQLHDTAQEEVRNLKARVTQGEARVTQGEAELADAARARQEAESNLAKTDQELRDLESEVVRLNTELAICKAELDASTGSRQQRAAEQSDIEATRKENSQLSMQLEILRTEALNAAGLAAHATERYTTLKKELNATLVDLQELAKASVEAEKEREEIDRKADGLRDQLGMLEVQLADERIDKMGSKSPVSDTCTATSQRQSTSVMMLRSEFKKMMRNVQVEHQKVLKMQEEERRKLAGQLRALRNGSSATI